MANIANQTSSSTHGGSPSSFSGNAKAGGKFILRIGDSFSCPSHGSRTITGGSSTVNNSNGVARVGDSISCGATLTNGVTSVNVG